MNEDEKFDYELFWRARDPKITAFVWLLGAFYFVGSAGGLWYLLHRTAQFIGNS